MYSCCDCSVGVNVSMFGDFKKELEGISEIESEFGFATYKITGEEIYIEDIYIKPEYRKSKHASDLADAVSEIGTRNGCKRLWGSVCPSKNNSTISLKALLGYGFSLRSSKDNFILLVKELI